MLLMELGVCQAVSHYDRQSLSACLVELCVFSGTWHFQQQVCPLAQAGVFLHMLKTPSFPEHVVLHDSSDGSQCSAGGPRALRTRQLSFRPQSKHMLLLACFAMEDVKPDDVPKVLELRCQGARECWSCVEALLLVKCNPDLLLHSLLFAFFMWQSLCLRQKCVPGVAGIFIN